MVIVENQPRLSDLHGLATKLKFPLGAASVVAEAKRLGYPQEVVGFYKTFPEDYVFTSRDDFLDRTDLLEVLHHDLPEEPPEELHVAEEY